MHEYLLGGWGMPIGASQVFKFDPVLASLDLLVDR